MVQSFNQIRLTNSLVNTSGGRMSVNGSGLVFQAETGGFGGSTQTGQLSGAFYPLNTNPSSYITTGQTGSFGGSTNTGILTGTFYPLSGNPSSYITSGQTGAFGGSSNTGVLTGVFYPLLSNPSSYITTGQTGAFGGGSTPTGQLTGAFYPLIANPSFYVTSGQTGVFVTTNQTGIFTSVVVAGGSVYSYINLSGISGILVSTGVSGQVLFNGGSLVQTSQTGNFITTSQTGSFNYVTPIQSGSLTGAFYPLSSNPSSYITTGQTGVFTSIAVTGGLIQSYVNLTGSNGMLVTTGVSGQVIFNGVNFALTSQTGTFVTTTQTGTLTGNFARLNVNNNFSGVETIYNSNNINLLIASGNYTGYQQINLTNLNSGQNASADLVCTNNIGSETGFYIDLGINSSTYTGAYIGYSGDSYLFNVGNNFYIGNAQSGKSLYLFAGNAPYSGNNVALTIYQNKIGINNSNPQYNLDVSGSGNFYSGLNVAGFPVITSGQTGAFYPQTNPSGYVTTGQTGNFVDFNSTQTISGAKTFASSSVRIPNFLSSNITSYGNSTSSIGIDNCQISDSNNGALSIDWNNRWLYKKNAGIGTTVILDWQNQILSGNWQTNTGPLLSTGNIQTGTTSEMYIKTSKISFTTTGTYNLITIPSGFLFLINSMEVLTSDITTPSGAPYVCFGNTISISGYINPIQTVSNSQYYRHIFDNPQNAVSTGITLTTTIYSGSTAIIQSGFLSFKGIMIPNQ